MYVKPTFLTVMFVLMQYKAMAALTNVRAHCVDALVLAAAVVLAALVFVCEGHTCDTSLAWKREKDDRAAGSRRLSRGNQWKDEALRKGEGFLEKTRSKTTEANSGVRRQKSNKPTKKVQFIWGQRADKKKKST